MRATIVGGLEKAINSDHHIEIFLIVQNYMHGELGASFFVPVALCGVSFASRTDFAERDALSRLLRLNNDIAFSNLAAPCRLNDRPGRDAATVRPLAAVGKAAAQGGGWSALSGSAAEWQEAFQKRGGRGSAPAKKKGPAMKIAGP